MLAFKVHCAGHGVDTTLIAAWVYVLVALVSLAHAQNVVAYRAEGDAISLPLTGEPGDAQRGRALIVARDPANCVLCHAIPDPDTRMSGDVGPSLAGIGKRLSPAQIRLRVVDERRVRADSVMPAYHRIDGLRDVAPAYRGKPMLSARDIEDIVAYLATLK